MKHCIDFSELGKKWGSAWVARKKFGIFTGGLISPKSLANLDSQGLGPAGRVRVGRDIVYPLESAIAWLEKRVRPVN